jgi:hypothetical protein
MPKKSVPLVQMPQLSDEQRQRLIVAIKAQYKSGTTQKPIILAGLKVVRKRFRLEAVGMEWDGNYRPIRTMQYGKKKC